MVKRLIGLLTAAAALTAAAPLPVAGRWIYGHWQVVGVAVADSGVQALIENDPTYMGRRLTFSRRRLAWDRPKAISTEAPCIAPAFRPARPTTDPEARSMIAKLGVATGRSALVRCATGSWGPGQPPAVTFVALRDGTIGLWWYDGGLLRLRRIG